MTPTTRRRGFSLMELLVVIAIIAILAALTSAAVFYWVGAQQRRNTEATIRSVDQVLQKQWAAVIADAKKEDISDAVKALAGGDLQRARVIWIKFRLAEAFPVRFGEINANPGVLDSYITPPSRRKYTSTYRKALAGRTTSPAESSACLLLALTVERGGAVLSPDLLGPAVADTDGDGLKELVDGWQKPLSFERFAWNNADLQASTTRKTRFADPLDPSGLLTRNIPTDQWYGSANSDTFQKLFHPIKKGDTPQGMTTYYVAPVIYSGGGDNDPATPADNIYSFKLKGSD